MKAICKMGLFVSVLLLTTLFTVSCEDDDKVNGTCRVTLVCNVNPGKDGDIIEYEVNAGDMFEAPALERNGFEFAGWYTDQASAKNQKKDAVLKFKPYDLEMTPIYLDVTLYGRWVK